MKKYLATLMGITITSLFTAHAQDAYFGINGGYLNNKKTELYLLVLNSN